MTIFNKGNRVFAHPNCSIKRNAKTIIPKEHEEWARKLLKNYPDELIEGDGGDVAAAALTATVTALQADNAKLKAQVEKLQQVLVSDPQRNDARAVANRRADQAEEGLAKAQGDLVVAQQQIADLTAQIEKLTAPAAEAAAQA